MKEEALTKNLPPKMSGGSRSGASTPSKSVNDEILSSLLRINNFDSISSLKDESLDIDLSACVTISADSAMMMTGNSLSTTDFWRVLDESAQNSQLDLTLSSDGETIHMRNEALLGATDLPPHILLANSTPDAKLSKSSLSSSSSLNDFKNSDISIKKETTTITTTTTPNTFSGTFLRPEAPPPGSSTTFSPLKKIVKNLQQHLQHAEKPPTKRQPRKQSHQQQLQQQQSQQQQQQHKTNMPINCIDFDNVHGNSKKSKGIHFIKEEPPEHLLMNNNSDNFTTSPRNNVNENNNNNNNNENATKINTSPTKFKIFMSTDASIEKSTLNVNNNKNNDSSIITTTTNNHNNNNKQINADEVEISIKDKIQATTTDSGTLAETKDIDITPQLFKCIDCHGLVLKGSVERGTHELIGHRVLFKCSVCVRDFEQESGLKKHMKTHRAVETRKDAWKKCPDCGKW